MTTKLRSRYQRYLAATLAVGSTFLLAAPTIATPAGTEIKNTATAVYEDDDGTSFNATSNEVTVTVQEVAAIFVTSLSTIDVNGGTVVPDDDVNFEFKVTNGGNDTTAINVPQNATVSGPASQNGTLQIVGVIDPQGNRTTYTTPINVNANTATDTLTAIPQITDNGQTHPAGVLPAGYSYIVNVPVKVDSLASSGANITVQLGDTGTNDNSPTSQNQNADNGTNDVSTHDADDGVINEAVGAVGQEKEASATTNLTVGSQAVALATLLKTHSTPVDGKGTPQLNDDEITYNLALRVESNPPAGSVGVTAGKLVGIDITLDSTPNTKRVLISDAIPTNTTLVGAPTATAANWVPVYTNSALSIPANKAEWRTGAPTGAVTRVGFIYDDTTNNAIDEGTVLTGFSFKVVTDGVTTTTNIANIAQVFGQTQGNEGPTAPLVYDESGDQSPSNFNDNGTPGPTSSLTPGSPDTSIPNGVADPTNNGVDSGNDNSGTGPGGEDNVVTIAAPGQILNGPSGQPTAVGPNDNNDDFTNRSAPVDPNTTPGTSIDPNEVEFTNTISNPGTAALTDLLLVPDAANFTPGTGEVLPPNGTLVTLTYGGNTAVYRFDTSLATPNFVFESGTAITIPTLAPSQAVDYTVKIDLPANTPLSTDTENGFSVPLYVFNDLDGDSRPDPNENQNRTIDRVYTGFLKLTKQARILDTDGTTELVAFTDNSAALNAQMANGRFIEYKITYKNISIAPVGSNNITLNSKNIVITEDGDNTTNTWATEINGEISTSHVVGQTTGTFGATQFFPAGEQSGTTKASDVEKYEHRPGVVIQPQASGDFIFRRKVN